MPWKDAEKRAEYVRRWAAANPDKTRAAQKRWRQRNPTYKASWRALNRDVQRQIYIVSRHRRRAAGHLGRADVAFLKTSQPLCAYCLSAPAAEIEHCTPISRGGLNDLDNVVMACTSCNRRKGASTVLEFLAPWLRMR